MSAPPPAGLPNLSGDPGSLPSRRAGSGPALLLLHGHDGSGALSWFRCFEPLGRRFSVIAPDLPGHGAAGSDPGVTLEACADRAAALLDGLGSTAVVAGFSMGGAIAQLVARRHPDRVAGLVLCATWARLAGSPIAPGDPPRRPDDEWIEEETSRNDRETLDGLVHELVDFDSRAWVGVVGVPVEVLVTAADDVIDPAAQRELATLAGAGCVEVAGSHRALMYDEGGAVAALVAACERAGTRSGLLP